MAKKDIKFTLDTIDSRYSPVGTVKQLDSVFFYIKITENGVTKDLTGQTIKLFAIKEDKKIVEQTTKINITNQREGLVEIELLNAAIQVHGFTYFELEISDSNGIISTADFILRVNKRVGSPEAIESTNEVSTLKEIEVYVAQAKQEIKEFKALQSEMLETNDLLNRQEALRAEAENLRIVAEERRYETLKKIENKFNQINYLDTPSKIFENSRFVRYANDGQPNAIHVTQDGSSTIHFYKINPMKRYFFNQISSGLSKIAFFASLEKNSGMYYFAKDTTNWNQEITAPSNANYVALEFIPDLANTMFLGEIEKFDLFKKYEKNTELNSKILVKDLEDRIEKLEKNYVTIGKNGDFNTIKEGFKYAFENDMKVKIESGVYNLVDEGISGEGYLAPKEILGYGVTLICDLPEENWELSPINISMDSKGSKIYGLTIICNNCRYCIHDDMGGQMVGDIKIPFYHNVYKDLKLIHKSPQSSILRAPQCIGGGLGDYGFIEIDNCVFESQIYADVSYHSKSWNPQTPQKNNCIVMCKDSVFKSTFSISAIGDDTSYMNTIYISNCLMKTLPDKRERPNIEFVEWNNTKRM
ncbi:TPA: BppU family phage baseplate upper protein [Clostridium perfringens]